MLVKFYDEGGSAGDPSKQPPVKDPTSTLEKPDSNKEQPGKEEGKQPEKPAEDYKAKYEEEVAFRKRLQSETTAKLQRLAEIERQQEEQRQKAVQDDDITRIDSEIKTIDEEIAAYKAEKIITKPLEVQRSILERQKRDAQSRREEKLRRDTSQKVLDRFKDDHPGFKDFGGLSDVIDEFANKGEVIGLNAAHTIWESRQKLKQAKESEAIDEETRRLSDKAKGQDGKPPAPKGKTPSDKVLKDVWGID